MQNKKNESKLKDIISFMNLKKNNPEEYVIKIGENPSFRTNTIPELSILSYINSIPIIVYDELNNPIYIYDNGLKYMKYNNKNNEKYNLSDKEINKYTDKNNKIKSINMRFIFVSNNEVPDFIEILYYK
jgi:hypothetical protein